MHGTHSRATQRIVAIVGRTNGRSGAYDLAFIPFLPLIGNLCGNTIKIDKRLNGRTEPPFRDLLENPLPAQKLNAFRNETASVT